MLWLSYISKMLFLDIFYGNCCELLLFCLQNHAWTVPKPLLPCMVSIRICHCTCQWTPKNILGDAAILARNDMASVKASLCRHHITYMLHVMSSSMLRHFSGIWIIICGRLEPLLRPKSVCACYCSHTKIWLKEFSWRFNIVLCV